MNRERGFENHRLRTLIWIVRQLEKHPMSLEELNDRWIDDVDISGGHEMIRKTFFNHRKAILDLFGIEIECERKDDYKYRIDYADDDKIVSLMMENFEENLALGNSTDLPGRVLVDKAPQGILHLEKIMEAMRSSRNITILFQDFKDDEPWEVTGSPYCVKLYQQRWYVVIKETTHPASSEEEESSELPLIDTYSLDRIKHVRVEKTKFVMDSDFNAGDFFRYSFGVRVNQVDEPSMIKLKVASVQCPYFRSLPLHPSQQEIETTDDYSIFTMELVPTIELTMKLLSYGFLVEVLEPSDYRQVIMTELASAYHKYFNE